MPVREGLRVFGAGAFALGSVSPEMVDFLQPEQRSALMARVANRNTGPEVLVRRLLHATGYRFRLHRADLPGTPDIVLPRHKTVIFVHGCFWHGHTSCVRAKRPSTNQQFWHAKIDNNIRRDQQNQRALRKLGWQVLILWQCGLKDTASVLRSIKAALPSK
jgi:DNA mismatch endonuclease (patch repair protein)